MVSRTELAPLLAPFGRRAGGIPGPTSSRREPAPMPERWSPSCCWGVHQAALGRVVGLTFSDVDLDKGTVRVRRPASE